MTTAYTSLLGLALPVTGELSGTWGDTVNNSITSLLDTSVAGTTNVSVDTDVTLTTTTGAANTARQAILLFSGARTALRTVTAPAQSKVYTVINATTGGFSVKLVGAGPTTGVTIVAGESAVCAWNGSDFVKVSNAGGSSSFVDLTVSGNLTLSGGTANGVAYLNGSKVVTSGSALTFDGTNFTVGASATTGDYKAFIQKAGGELLGLNASSGTLTRIAFGNATASFGSTQIIANASDLAFITNSAEQMRLTSTGLGIGTSSPAQTLHVKTSTALTPITLGVLSNANTLPALSFNGAYASTTMAGTYSLSGSLYTTVPSGAAQYFLIADSIKATLDSSGNLGLGVTPSAWSTSVQTALQVYTAGVSGNGGGNTASRFTHGCYLDGSTWRYQYTGVAPTRYEVVGANAGSTHSWSIAAGGTAGNAITFTQAMTLNASGQLGIGTTSPAQRLDVAGTLRFTPNTADLNYSADIFANYDSSHPFQINVKNNGTSQEFIGVYADGGGGNERVAFPTGNVGIGTTSPAARLNVSSTGNGNRALFDDTTNDNTLGIYSDSTDIRLLSLNNSRGSYKRLGFQSNVMVFSASNGSESARIDTSGNLLVGITSGSNRLVVNGTNTVATFTSSSTSTQIAIQAANSAGANSRIYMECPGVNAGGFGYVRSTSRLYAWSSTEDSGPYVVANGTSWTTNSDARLKTNVQTLGYGLTSVLALLPKEYEYKVDEGKKCLGFIAQDVIAVIPELVDVPEDSNEMMGIEYQAIIPVLVKAIQEQQAIIESLKARLDAANL